MAKITRAVSLNDLKQAAAESAAALLTNGMIVGLGSGSTATLAVKAIGKRVQEGLQIVGIPTSEQTAELARELGIPLSDFAEHEAIDITIDGADEVELRTLNLIKGRGGALLREKIVVSSTSRFVVVVDETKLVDRLPFHDVIPIEVVPFGWQATAKRLRQMGAKVSPRMQPDGKFYITDGGHYILECGFGAGRSATELARELDSVVGVVEHGLFLRMASEVIIGTVDGVRTLYPEQL